MKKFIKAFTLLEISVVVLIIGVILVGIVQGNKMLRTARLNSAETLTLSAPTQNIKGMSLWLESTVAGSFSTSSISDGDQLTQWNDRNSHATSKYYATKAASSAVTYKKESPLHTLPAVYFNGTSSGYLTLSTSTSPSDATTAPVARNNAFTIIAVAKSDGVSSSNGAALISNGDSGGYSYVINSSGERQLVFPGSATLTSTSATASTNPEVISVTYEGGTDGIAKLFTNGVAESMNASTATATAPDGALYVGGNPSDMPWKGYVGEVIVFNRLLSDNERKQIEQYLGQKYKIDVNSEIKPSAGFFSGNISDCTFSLSGIAETHVSNRDGVLSCIPGYSGSITYNCAGTSFSVVSGVCTPTTCTISGQAGITDGTTVNYGTTSQNCNIAGYSGTVTYNSCVSGAATVTGNTCAPVTCTISGQTGITNGTTVNYGTTSQNCNIAGYSGTVTYNSCVSGAATVTGNTCAPVTCTISGQTGITNGTTVNYGTTSQNCNIAGYSGTVTYNSCVSGAATVTGNTCALATCTISGQTGITNGTTVNYGTTSQNCNIAGYSGAVTYDSCVSGAANVTANNCAPQFYCTSGGSITSSGGRRIHTFTSGSTTLTTAVCSGYTNDLDILVVASGGGGSNGQGAGAGGGGGGAGGLVLSADNTVTVTGSFSIVVGAGGAIGNNGNDSSFSGNGISLSATGGGRGGFVYSGTVNAPGTGSGGSNPGSGGGGLGKASNVSPSGNMSQAGGSGGYTSGGTGYIGTGVAGGGGGGHCGSGTTANISTNGKGGAGCSYDITGSSVIYAPGGGGGGADNSGRAKGTGGNSATCGGDGAYYNTSQASTQNCYGGGGGGGGNGWSSGAAGKSGVVIISYPL